jgi:hypothetical protein
MYTAVGNYCSVYDCLLPFLDCSNPSRTTDSQLKRIIITNGCIHTVVPPDDGPRYARNMWRLTKCTKTKLCIKLVLLYTIISRCGQKQI